jgi:predicted phage terminase large subunit-like protein
VNEFFRLLDRWRPLKARVEGVAYQRTLKWILEQEMKKRGRFVQVDCPSDRRSKVHRIDQALSGMASHGRLFVSRAHTRFLEQFGSFPMCKHDDVLDASARAAEAALDFAGMEGSVPEEETGEDTVAAGFGASGSGEWRWAP